MYWIIISASKSLCFVLLFRQNSSKQMAALQLGPAQGIFEINIFPGFHLLCGDQLPFLCDYAKPFEASL